MKATTNSIRGPLENAAVLRRHPSAPSAINVTLAMALALAAMYVALAAFDASTERSAGIRADAFTTVIGTAPTMAEPGVETS